MDITNRDGTLTYHIQPTHRVRLKNGRTWYFVRDGSKLFDNREALLLYRSFADAEELNARWEQVISHEFFCQNAKEIKLSLEADLEKEAL